MHVPDVTDEMFDKVLGFAASPIVLVLHAGRGAVFRFLEALADDFDDRLIFLALNVDEHPSYRCLVHGELPVCVAYKSLCAVSRWDSAIGRGGYALRTFLQALLPAEPR